MNEDQPKARSARVAYLLNQYPTISHTFIRNEILALEQAGFDVLRISIRGWDAPLVEPIDLSERTATAYLLRNGLLSSFIALVRSFVFQPIRTFSALILAIRMSIGGERSLPYHLVYLAEACLALRLTKRHKSQHVHAHFGSNSAEVAMLLKELGGPDFSFTVHGPEEFDKPYQLKLREKIKASSFVVGVSSFGRSQLYRHCEADDWPKVQVVHCGLGNEYLDGEPLDFIGIPRLVCVGRLCEQKGQLLLIRACAILAARGVDFEVVLVGEGDMRADIEELIARLDLQKHVSLTGWLGSSEIRSLLVGSKGSVLPSFAEGLPVVIMESMAVGKPVIASYVAGIPELIRDKVDGFLVIAGDEQDLANAMQSLLELNEHALEKMGKSARSRVLERHSACLEAKKLGKLFSKNSPTSAALESGRK